ncbi:H(+)/Cl(-) exchange transporter 7-like [Tubulanus polymorphus]|uniref:H(+)/Cl(-) exchange transporter 7-like n=1 Tax=Tubulanus polymorphus TaxID=672921 RepID=UPI003DA6BC8B
MDAATCIEKHLHNIEIARGLIKSDFTVTPVTVDLPISDNYGRAPPRNQLSSNSLNVYDNNEGDSFNQNSVTQLLGRKFRSLELKKIEEEERKKQAFIKPLKRLVSKFESLDYEICENLPYRKEQKKQRTVKIQRTWFARWIVAILIGLGTAIVAVFVEVSIEHLTEYKSIALQFLIEHGMKTSLVIPFLGWLAINLFLTSIGAALIVFFEPAAAGSGIPEIKCYLNGVKIPGLLSIRCLLAKVVGVVFSVTGGLAVGKEGPMIHAGTIVAAGVSQGRCRVFQWDFKIFESFRSDHERRDFVSGGAAAGVAAAFGAPVGGVLFALEEGASFWNQTLTWRIVFSSMIATFSVNVFLSAIHGHSGDLSNPGLISLGYFPDISYHLVELPIFIAMGIFGGLSGAFFVFLNYKLTLFRKRYVKKKLFRFMETLLIAGTIGISFFILIYAIDDCKVPANNKEHHYEGHETQMFCKDGEYNTLTKLLFKTPEGQLKLLLHESPNGFGTMSLAMYSILYYFFACWSCGVSASTGIFIPSLLSGAIWGRLVGIGVINAFPSMEHNVGKYALIGAACSLGGVTRMTISLTVMLIECTGDITFGPPLVLVIIIAKYVGDFFNSGIYDLLIELNGMPFLPWEPPELSTNITADKIMNTPVVTLEPIEKVGNIIEILRTVKHNGFPVVENFHPEMDMTTFGKMTGLILRSQLALILRKKAFDRPGVQTQLLRPKDFRDSYPRFIPVKDLDISEEEKNCTLDLRPYMNPVPYTVNQYVSLPRVFKLFRGLGLRHIVVTDDDNNVLGMVTRKDLARFRMQSKRLSLLLEQLSIIDT